MRCDVVRVCVRLCESKQMRAHICISLDFQVCMHVCVSMYVVIRASSVRDRCLHRLSPERVRVVVPARESVCGSPNGRSDAEESPLYI